MKRKPFWLFVIAALCFIAVVIFWWKPGIVPNDAVGQEKTTILPGMYIIGGIDSYSIEIGDTIKIKFKDKEYLTDYPPEMFLGLLAVYNELKLYSAECYADSSYVTRSVDTGTLLYMVEQVWVHREPTLPGFMEFLEKKYER